MNGQSNCVASNKKVKLTYVFFFHGVTAPQWARFSSVSWLHDLTQAHHSRQEPSGRVISPSQRQDNTHNTHDTHNTQHSQHSQHTTLTKNIHSPSEIRTRNPKKTAAVGPTPQTARPLGPADLQLHTCQQTCLYVSAVFVTLM